MISRRVPQDLRPSVWAQARAARGRVPYDLTVSNPTLCDFPYPHGLLEPLRRSSALQYRPDPKGLRSAREAVAREYAAAGVTVDPEQIVLTASSSESYGFLFKLLCNPGDAVLVPTPSYPLFTHLAALEGVHAVPYLLDQAGGWQPVAPEAASTELARAAILVHPNNPTGSWVGKAAAEALAVCRPAAPLPLIVDEVFLDYPLAPHPEAKSFAARSTGLTFTLGGLSKSRGLPQLKLSWIVTSGPEAEVVPALDALAFIGDSYLSVGTPIQEGLSEILDGAAPVRDAILARCVHNLATAKRSAGGVPGVELLAPSAGWSAILRFPRVVTEDALVLELLEKRGVAVHPGYFFDFPAEGCLVLSLLPAAGVFEAGLALTLDAIAARL
jgi:aspartate/methionine/tyrosine aminotransferase